MKYIVSLVILSSALALAHALLALFQINFPAPVLGMGILLLAMKLNTVSLTQCERAGNYLLRYFPLFFIPAGVGIVQYLDLIRSNALLIVIAVLCATIGTLFIVGKLAAYLFKKTNRETS